MMRANEFKNEIKRLKERIKHHEEKETAIIGTKFSLSSILDVQSDIAVAVHNHQKESSDGDSSVTDELIKILSPESKLFWLLFDFSKVAGEALAGAIKKNREANERIKDLEEQLRRAKNL